MNIINQRFLILIFSSAAMGCLWRHSFVQHNCRGKHEEVLLSRRVSHREGFHWCEKFHRPAHQSHHLEGKIWQKKYLAAYLY